MKDKDVSFHRESKKMFWWTISNLHENLMFGLVFLAKTIFDVFDSSLRFWSSFMARKAAVSVSELDLKPLADGQPGELQDTEEK